MPSGLRSEAEGRSKGHWTLPHQWGQEGVCDRHSARQTAFFGIVIQECGGKTHYEGRRRNRGQDTIDEGTQLCPCTWTRHSLPQVCCSGQAGHRKCSQAGQAGPHWKCSAVCSYTLRFPFNTDRMTDCWVNDSHLHLLLHSTVQETREFIKCVDLFLTVQ